MVAGNGPITSAFLRYNRRCVPVLSLVSQFAYPPSKEALRKLDQWCVHTLLGIPAKCTSRKLCHSISFCTEMDPIPLNAYCIANLVRFAHSETD